MNPARTLVHGLVVESEFELGTNRHAAAGRTVDLRIARRETRVLGDEPPPGVVVASVADERRRRPFSTTSRSVDGVLRHRVHGVCELEYAAGGTSLAVDVDPRRPRGLDGVVVAGAGLAIALVQRARLVLHASAVELPDGGAVGFLGASGMGKSTQAAVCCAAGATVLADDVLRVDVEQTDVVAHAGSGVVRLRPAAAELLKVVGRPVSESADGRIVVELPCSAHPTQPLRALLVVVRTDDRPFGISSQRGRRALLLLESFPRLLGWNDPWTAPVQFDLRSRLAATVHIGVVTTPMTPPFDRARARAVFAEIGALRSGRGIPLPAS